MHPLTTLVPVFAVLASGCATRPHAEQTTTGQEPAHAATREAEDVAAERAANEAAYRSNITAGRAYLVHRYLGDWVVIAGGRAFPTNAQHTTVVPARTVQEAVAAADREVPEAHHRFVFRIGEEGDFEQDLGGAEVPHVLGVLFFAELEWAGIELKNLGPRGRLHTVKDGVRVEITTPVADDLRMFVRPEVGAPAAQGKADAHYVLSTGFTGMAVMPQETAARAQLCRWEIPGKIRIEALAQPGGECRRARARFRFPGTDLDLLLPVAIWPR